MFIRTLWQNKNIEIVYSIKYGISIPNKSSFGTKGLSDIYLVEYGDFFVWQLL